MKSLSGPIHQNTGGLAGGGTATPTVIRSLVWSRSDWYTGMSYSRVDGPFRTTSEKSWIRRGRVALVRKDKVEERKM